MSDGMHASQDNQYHDGIAPQAAEPRDAAGTAGTAGTAGNDMTNPGMPGAPEQPIVDFDDDSQFDFTQAMPAIQAPPERSATTKRRLRTARTATAAIVSAGLLVAATLCATIAPWRSTGDGTSTVYAAQVSRTQQQAYCPQRMALADTASYGDSAFQVSEGNIASQGLVAATGSVTGASLANLAGKQTAQLQTADSSSLSVASASMNDASQLANATFADSADGTGMFGAVASWATQGDLEGLSATQCVVTATQQRFVVPPTQTGWTEQLVIANPGTTSAAVDLTAWGTSQQGSLSLATDATVTVQAGSETVVNLSAAANAQRGLVVDLDSHTIPVAAVVRSVSMDGLNPNGSDYVTASAAASTTQIVPTVASLGDATLTLFSMDDADVTVSWLTKDGTKTAQQVKVYSQQVILTDLGSVPDGAYALEATSSSPITAQVRGTRDGGSQSDFAISGSQDAARVFGVALPGSLSTTLVLSNPSDVKLTAAITTYDASGKKVGAATMSLAAGASTVVDPSKIGSGAAMAIVQDTTDTQGTTDGDAAASEPALHVAASISQTDVSAASLQGIAVIEGTSLDAATSLVTATRDQRIVS